MARHGVSSEGTIADVVGYLSGVNRFSEDRGWEYSAEFLTNQPSGTVADFAEFLNSKGVVTNFEADRIREGHSERLLLGDYVLRQPIGSGSLGTTYLAERRTDGQKFSVMVLPLRSIWHVHQAKKVVEHFTDFPGHPSVVPLVDIDTANQFHYLAWPYVEGDTLEHMVSKRGPYVVHEVIKIATSIVEALAFCKKFSIIHGYLRPSKIIHPRKGGVTIIEWGVGAILSENIDVEDSFLDTISSATAVTQSIDCVAPELFANPLARTEFTDQYALGCTLYFLLTGQFPFPKGTIVEKMIAHQTHTPTPLIDRVRRIPAEISGMIDRLLAKDPANRFPDWNEPLAILRTASQGMLDTEPTTAAISQLMDTIENEAVSTPNTRSLKTVPHETGSVVTFDFSDFDGKTENSFGIANESASSTSTNELSRNQLELPSYQAKTQVTPIVLKPRSGLVAGSTAESTAESKKELVKTKLNFDLPEVIYNSQISSDFLKQPTDPQNRFFLLNWLSRLAGWLKFVIPKKKTEELQVCLFGPPHAIAGQTVKLQAFVHPVETFQSITTVAKVFSPDSELIASGKTSIPIPIGGKLSIFLGVHHSVIAAPLTSFTYNGETQPKCFDVHIPWESTPGPFEGALSVALDQVRIARVAFQLQVVSRAKHPARN